MRGKTPRLLRRRTPHSHDSKDGMMRVYIATTLLLLFIDRFTSLHGVPRNFMVVKEPTYKIRASNSINNGGLRRRSAVDPAVRMASAPAGRSKVNCFEKTLTRFVSQNRVIFYHGFGGMSIFRQKFFAKCGKESYYRSQVWAARYSTQTL